MRRFLSTVLVTVMTMAGAPLGVVAAQQNSIALRGRAFTAKLQTLPDARVQIRDLNTAQIVNSTTSNATGEFSFEGLKPGDYIVELADASGNVLGMSAPFTLGAARAATVSVVAVAPGAVTAGTGAGFSLFGLGPVSSVAVLGAAGAAAVTAVVATRQDASPSR
jgi:carboxypeptidase family protein